MSEQRFFEQRLEMSEQRFRAAVRTAAQLHPDLLSQSQKLRLYSLFRQSQKPAPEQPPADASELALLKWEAWRDARGFSGQEAMDAYSDIIDGLVAMMEQLEREEKTKDAAAEAEEAADSAAEEEEEEEEQEKADDEANDDDDDDADADDDDDDDDEQPPEVTRTVWSTGAVAVGAGATFEVPLVIDCACRCSYSFSIVSGTGPIRFRLQGPHADGPSHEYVSEYQNEHEGHVDVAPPGVQAGSASCILCAILDNTASLMSSIEVRCHVKLEPLVQLRMLEEYSSRQALKGLIRRKESSLEAHDRHYARIGHEAQALDAEVAKLRETLVRAEGELRLKHAQMEQGAEIAELMLGEINALRKQLSKPAHKG
jgi:acyl-CoA-binding protein